jgi:hypothetical protein
MGSSHLASDKGSEGRRQAENGATVEGGRASGALLSLHPDASLGNGALAKASHRGIAWCLQTRKLQSAINVKLWLSALRKRSIGTKNLQKPRQMPPARQP